MRNTVPVRVTDRACHFAKDPHRLSDRKLSHARELGAQRFAFDERHREIRRAIHFTRRQQRHDVRVLELCRELDLPAKALDAQLGGDVGGEHLDDDLAAEIAIHRHEDAAHPGADDLALEGIAIAEGSFEGRPKVRHAANLWVDYSLRQRQ